MRANYEALIQAFVNCRLPANEFEKQFLKAFKDEPAGMDPQVFEVLDALFSDVDSYSPDCAEGKETAFEISEAALRRQAVKALDSLQRLREATHIPA